MHAVADTLDWEQAHHAAPPQPARTHLQLVDGPAGSAPAAPPWQDKLQAVPGMRSALIPLDDPDGWSKPFSLVKADFEPWLSYYAGYRASRLFLTNGDSVHAELDYPVRALLALKKLDHALISNPPVQIDGPVEYFDASRAPRAGRDAAVAQSLARAAEAMHRSQLRRAHERGLEMGNHLHDALLGEGLSQLILAWQRAYRRKPNPHELHIMLTTGRTAPVNVPEPTAAPAAVRRDPSPGRSHPTIPAAVPIEPVPTPVAKDAACIGEPEVPARNPALRYLVHVAGAAGAAALAYLMMY